MKKRFLSILVITVMITTTIQAQIPTNGLVAWYPFSGNANDSSGNGNNGSVNGATLTNDRFGKENSAYSFVKASGGITVPFFKALDSNYTISYWANYSSNTINTSICDLAHDWQNNGSFVLFRDLSNILSYGTPGSNGTSNNKSIVNPTSLSLNKWHHIIAIRKGSILELFVNGVLVSKGSNNIFGNISSKTLFIGGDPNQVKSNANAAFSGILDDIRIYNNALDSMGVQTLYHEGGFALPVTINNISISNNDELITVNWQTATEINTSHFIIQHSTNGSSFTDIGIIKEIGSGANSYSFTDKNPTNNVNYYRLQCVDKDGSSCYSKVVSVNFVDKQSFSIVPNPAKDFATISFSKTVDNATISVYDITGKTVITQSLSGSANSYKLNTQTLTNGVYVIKVNTATGSYNEKLLINK